MLNLCKSCNFYLKKICCGPSFKVNGYTVKVGNSAIFLPPIDGRQLSFRVGLFWKGFVQVRSKQTNTVQILCIGTDKSHQTVQTKIRLLLKKQSDQGLRCLPFHPHLLDALMQCYFKLFYF